MVASHVHYRLYISNGRHLHSYLFTSLLYIFFMFMEQSILSFPFSHQDEKSRRLAGSHTLKMMMRWKMNIRTNNQRNGIDIENPLLLPTNVVYLVHCCCCCCCRCCGCYCCCCFNCRWLMF